MGRVPRPEVEPGPRRDLADALHALHHEAGWPSLRVLARRAGCSHTTVSAVLSSAKLPSWGVVEVVVEAMGGDPERIRGLWLAASEPTPGPGRRSGWQGAGTSWRGSVVTSQAEADCCW